MDTKNHGMYVIERLEAAKVGAAELRDLALLLVDAVDSGAAVSFLQPLSVELAETWWRGQLESAARSAKEKSPIVLVAREPAGRIVGTVQAQPAWAPNQPHRAEICKMLVHREARRQGLGRRLMNQIEQAARAAGFTLLTLDARGGGPAEALYRAMGWTFVGEIPDYAIDADGRGMHSTVIFYKKL